jgi:hypothetical protein
MTEEDYDELSTKRDLVRLLANDATAEQLDAAMHACIDNRLNDAERRTLLIQTIYRSWYERLGKRPRPPGADLAPTWEDVRRMFVDIRAMIGATPASSEKKTELLDIAAPIPRLPVGGPEPPQQTSSPEIAELQDVATPMARLSVGPEGHSDDSTVHEHIRRALDEPPPQPTSSDEKSGATAPIRARLSLDWARTRPIR